MFHCQSPGTLRLPSLAPVYPRGVSHIRALLLASSLALAPAIAPGASIQVIATSPVVIALGDSVSFIIELSADPGTAVGSAHLSLGREFPSEGSRQ